MEEYYKLEHKIDKLWREICCIKKGIANGMYFEYTYAEAEALRASNDLVPNALYLITDRGDDGVYMNALSPNTFDVQGVWMVSSTVQDIIYYDFPNDVVYYREDKQNNRIWGEDNINNFYFNTVDIENNYISSDSDVKLIAGSHTPITFKNMSFINTTINASDELFSGVNENTKFINTLITNNTVNVTAGKPTFLDSTFENSEIASNVFYQHGLEFENNVFKNTQIDGNTAVQFFKYSFINNDVNYFTFSNNTMYTNGFDGSVYIHNNTAYGDVSNYCEINNNEFHLDSISTAQYIINNYLKNGATISLNVMAVTGDIISHNTLYNDASINSNTSINKSGGNVYIQYNTVYYNGHINSNEECTITNNEVYYNLNSNISCSIVTNTCIGSITSNTYGVNISGNYVGYSCTINNNTSTGSSTIDSNNLSASGYIINCSDANISNTHISNTSGVASIGGTISNTTITDGSTVSGGAGYNLITSTLICSSYIGTPGTYFNQFLNNVTI